MRLYSQYPDKSWLEQIKDEKEVEIGENIYCMPKEVFKDCKKIKKVSFPEEDKLEEIGDSAFQGCSSLETIELPDSVYSIGKSAFAFCKSLKEIHLPDRLHDVSERCFYECSDLERIELSEETSYIGYRAFAYCANLKSINLQEIHMLRTEAFRDCTSLEEVRLLSPYLDKIEAGAFYNCKSLRLVQFVVGDLREIQMYAFWNCCHISELYLPKKVELIGKRAFEGCSALKTIHMAEKTYVEPEAIPPWTEVVYY